MPATWLGPPGIAEIGQTCTATVGSLPDAGSGTPAWWLVLALALILTGGALLLRARRARATATMVTLLAAGVLLLPTGAPPAHADTTRVEYGAGCSLIAIDESAISWATPTVTSGLLPGDSVVALTVPVANSGTAPIRVSGRLGSGTARPGLSGQVRFDDAAGPIEVAPGHETVATLSIRVLPSADDHLQGTSTPLELVLTATAR